MKTKILTLSFCVFIFTQLYAQNTTTIILKDHSGSVHFTPEQEAKEKQVIKSKLLQNIQHPNDKVILLYLFRNSGSVLNAQEFVFIPPQDKSNKTDKLSQARTASALIRAKIAFIKKLEQGLVPNVPKSDQTRILEILPTLDMYLKQGGKVDILFLSDMIESSPRRADLMSLTSKADAENRAKRDVSKIKTDFGLTSSHYPALQIDCFLPVETMNTTEVFQFLPFYWGILFNDLFGTKNFRFHTLN